MTAKEYIKYSKRKQKEFKKNYPTSSKPRKLFKKNGDGCKPEEYIFSSNNWNGIDLLREYLEDTIINKSISHIEMKKEDGTVIQIYYSWRDDSTYVSIIVSKGEFNHDSYNIQWYKHRGNTSLITKNAYTIILGEYIELLNILNIELQD